jgi:acyl dehydratase
MDHTNAEWARLKGKELAPSDWFMIDQEHVNQFAKVARDEDAWNHTDPVRAQVFGGTTVQGLLLLSLIPFLLRPHLALPEGCRNGVNYGFDRLRFTSPVRVGKRVRAQATLVEFGPFNENWWKKTLAITIDVEDESKPALIADWHVVYM